MSIQKLNCELISNKYTNTLAELRIDMSHQMSTWRNFAPLGHAILRKILISCVFSMLPFSILMVIHVFTTCKKEK